MSNSPPIAPTNCETSRARTVIGLDIKLPKLEKLPTNEFKLPMSNPLNCEIFDDIDETLEPNSLDTLLKVPVTPSIVPNALVIPAIFPPSGDWNPLDNLAFTLVVPKLDIPCICCDIAPAAAATLPMSAGLFIKLSNCPGLKICPVALVARELNCFADTPLERDVKSPTDSLILLMSVVTTPTDDAILPKFADVFCADRVKLLTDAIALLTLFTFEVIFEKLNLGIY